MSGKPKPLMNRILLLFLLSLCFNASAQQMERAQPAPPVQDFVLEVPRLDPVKTLPEFRRFLNDIGELQFEGFCDSRKLLFLRCTSEMMPKLELWFREKQMSFYVKENTSISRAMSACDNTKEITDSKAASE
jgi:hypothetical protein